MSFNESPGADLGGCRVCTPFPPDMTCGFLLQLVFCQKEKKLCGILVLKWWCTPPKKILDLSLITHYYLVILYYVIIHVQTLFFRWNL